MFIYILTSKNKLIYDTTYMTRKICGYDTFKLNKTFFFTTKAEMMLLF